MTLRQLEIFVLIAKHMSFKAAADALYISPSAITQQINNLEEELDTKLFSRSSKHLSLTPAGHVFLNGASEILDKVKTTVEATTLTGKQHPSSIVIGYIGLSAAKILSQTNKNFHALFPSYDIQLLPCDPLEIPSLLRLKSIDIALLAKSYLEDDADISFDKLISYNYGFVLFKQHPLSNVKNISRDDIVKYKLVVPEKQYIPNSLIHKLQDMYGSENLITVNSQSELLVEIRTNNHIGIMPEYLYLSRRDIVSKPAESLGTDEYGFVKIRDNNSLPLNNYIDCLRSNHYAKSSLFVTSAMDIFN